MLEGKVQQELTIIFRLRITSETRDKKGHVGGHR